jgi:hypothetical protein
MRLRAALPKAALHVERALQILERTSFDYKLVVDLRPLGRP